MMAFNTCTQLVDLLSIPYCIFFQRWVACFSNLPVRITTTNGLEAQNRVLKEKYLHQNTLRTLSSVLTVMVEQFITDNLKR